jgi:homoserine dehydrogenase
MTAQKKIGLFGFGCVGKGLYDVLEANPSLPLSLQKVCVKTAGKKRPIPQELISYDKNDILKNEEIDLVVELIDDAEEAYHIVKEALTSGKDVISANKKMVATHLKELIAIQKEYGTKLLYEASVCGSIPIIRNLEEYYAYESLVSIEGICNGSSNYILSKLYNEGASYADALAVAQELGFAESNPRLDVGGFDSKYKLCILAAHAFGILLNPDEVLNLGIQNIRQADIERAKSKGQKIKLVAKASRSEDGDLQLSVLPQFVTTKHKLFAVENEWNAVNVKAQFSQDQLFVGKGAGDHPTAASVLSDITGWLRDYAYGYAKIKESSASAQADELLTVYVSAANEDALQQLPYEEIISRRQAEEGSSLIAQIKRSVLLRFSAAIESSGLFIAQTACTAGNIKEKKSCHSAELINA